MGISEAIANMGIGRLIALGIFGIIGLAIIAGIIVGTAAVLGPGRSFGPFRKGVEAEPERKRMPVSTRVLGWGIGLLAVGSGIVVAIYGLPKVSAWGIIGMGLGFGGAGLIVFYLIASREQKPKEETLKPAEEADPEKKGELGNDRH